MVRWSGERADRLVLSVFDGTVRVWDVSSAQCMALVQFNMVINSALFVPSDENYVLAIGRQRWCEFSTCDGTRTARR